MIKYRQVAFMDAFSQNCSVCIKLETSAKLSSAMIILIKILFIYLHLKLLTYFIYAIKSIKPLSTMIILIKILFICTYI